MFKQIALLSLVVFGTISCDSSQSDQLPNVEDFAIMGGGNHLEYDGKPTTSCDLADPNEIVVLLRIQNTTAVEYDPACDADEPYFWLSSVIRKGIVLGSTSPSIPDGSSIEIIEYRIPVSYPENYSGPYDAVFTIRDLGGVWVQGNKGHDGFAIDTTQKNTNELIDFPTNWSVLKSEIQTNQANYASECPSSTIVSQKEFETWAYSDPLDIKPGCSDPDPEPTCPASGCIDDGDDSHGADSVSP